MWQLILDIVYWAFMIVSGLLTLAIAVEPFYLAYLAIAKRAKARKYRRNLASEAVHKSNRRTE